MVGISVYYHWCMRCNFILTANMDRYSPDDFHKYIRIDEFAQVEVDSAFKRPKASAAVVEKMYRNAKADISVSEYGDG